MNKLNKCTANNSDLSYDKLWTTQNIKIYIFNTFSIQKSTHFIHKSIQYYIKIIDNNTKHQKFLEPAQLMGLWQLSQPL